MSDFALLTALTLGFFGSAHCVGMCGGIAGALGFAVREQSSGRRLVILLAYNVGRVCSYLVIAGLFFLLMHGALGVTEPVLPMAHSLSYLRLLAGLLMVAMGLYLGQWWLGLAYLERAGSWLWRYIQPLGKGLFPVKSPLNALLLGLVWGWLPCGLVYSALAFAVVQPSLTAALTTMLAFALGTLPALLATGLAAERIKQLLQNRRVRLGMALLVIGFGLWTAGAALYHGILHGQHMAGVEVDAEAGAPAADEGSDMTMPAMPAHHHH